MKPVDRYLEDKWFDHIDHALGRPLDPMGETYRNYYAIDKASGLATSFAATPHWALGSIRGDMAFFHVTPAGREALRDHLREIGDRNRVYIIIYEGHQSNVIATSRDRAKYNYWLDLSDSFSELTFGEFLKSARVRAA